jgi:proteasome lid subunit RPN8/RPN11
VSPADKVEQRTIPGLRHVCEATIYQHVFSNADREVGGVLVGRIARDGAIPTVTGAIPAIAADEQRAALTFTQDSWEHVHRVLDSEYPDERIVGWYHSHPAFGIFLSGHDLFIHRNFFSGRSQIALVIDPIAKEEGVFAWRRSKNDVDIYTQEPTPAGWYALGRNGAALTGQAGRQSPPAETTAKRLTLPLAGLALVASAGFVAAFAVSFIVQRHHSPSKRGQTVPAQTLHPQVQAQTSPTGTTSAPTTTGAPFAGTLTQTTGMVSP